VSLKGSNCVGELVKAPLKTIHF